jgi:hypothetical protein
MKPVTTKLYIIALVITVFIFLSAFFSSNYINNKRTEEIRINESKIAIDILSFETQFDVIEESSCQTFDKSSIKAQLQSLNSKLTFLEGQAGAGNPEVVRLKHYYALLQIRDYLLTKRMSEQCHFDNIFLLYFYTKENCAECRRQEYIVRAVRDKYPQIEVYSFDYMMDVTAVQTLISTNHIPRTAPIIDINAKAYAPFQSLADIEVVLRGILQATTTATSTKPHI